jgi:hypothetical protein
MAALLTALLAHAQKAGDIELIWIEEGLSNRQMKSSANGSSVVYEYC